MTAPKNGNEKRRNWRWRTRCITPSRFVYESLPETIRAKKKCLVAAFGSPLPPPVLPPERAARARPLRVLFAGSMTQRKGLADLFAAMKQINRRDVELVVMGSPVVPLAFYRQQGVDFCYEPPRPHAEVLRLMQSCDVLALPSIVEGRALVQQEALACGLPLIVTVNAGGDDLIEEGKPDFWFPFAPPKRLRKNRLVCRASGRAARHETRSAAQSGGIYLGALCRGHHGRSRPESV